MNKKTDIVIRFTINNNQYKTYESILQDFETMLNDDLSIYDIQIQEFKGE